jgi:Xaa-Pro aminopeptidase
MKLHELGAQRPTEQVAQTLAQRLGEHIDFDRLNESQARKMLGKVRGLLREHRSSVSRLFSERNPDYIKLVMLEQALTSRVQEQSTIVPGGTTPTQNPAAAMVKNDPKTRAVTDKVMRGQKLSPEEQETVNRLALAKENKKARRMVRESEIQTAQVVLAAQDMVDRVQGMLEDISEMQFKDLPALTDSIKNDMGVEQATQFQQQAAGALTQLLAAVQAGKTSLEGAQGILKIGRAHV